MVKKSNVKLTGYRFLSKDPVIDLWRTAKEQSKLSFEEIAAKSGITKNTLMRWDFGETRRPQHITLRFAMSACGYEEVFQGADGKVLKSSYALPKK